VASTTVFIILERNQCRAVADSRGEGWRGRPPSLAQNFFAISRLFPYERHRSLCAFAINEDEADTLSSGPTFAIFLDPPLT